MTVVAPAAHYAITPRPRACQSRLCLAEIGDARGRYCCRGASCAVAEPRVFVKRRTPRQRKVPIGSRRVRVVSGVAQCERSSYEVRRNNAAAAGHGHDQAQEPFAAVLGRHLQPLAPRRACLRRWRSVRPVLLTVAQCTPCAGAGRRQAQAGAAAGRYRGRERHRCGESLAIGCSALATGGALLRLIDHCTRDAVVAAH